MSDPDRGMQFTARHHALLFTSIAKPVIDSIGEEKGESLIRNAVIKYGQQRGKRMALRARKNGHALTMDNYLVYGEWELPKGEMEFKLMEKNPHARLHISKCPWHVIWKEKNLLDYGKYFCKEIDMALVKGFNPALELQINSTQTNGGELCDFVFKDARLSLFKMPAMIYRKKIKPGASATMPWEYHAGHLYKTMGDVIRQALNEKADGIMDSALDELASYFPETDVTTLKHYQHTDFDKLP